MNIYRGSCAHRRLSNNSRRDYEAYTAISPMSQTENDNSACDDDFIRRFSSCQRDLRAFIVGMTPSRSDADDVLQEVNLALWRKRRQYDSRQEFLRWAFGFAVLEIRSYRSRSAKSRIWFNDSVLESVAEAWPHDSNVKEQRREALTYCLQKLGAVEHQFITGYYGKQFSAQELAQTSGKPLSTVYKTLTRARESLRECVKRSIAREYHAV